MTFYGTGTGTGTGTKIWLFTGPGPGPGLKTFYTGPEQFFMQYIFTFIILTWLTMIKWNIFICYSHKSLYWFRICLQESQFSNYTDFWTHIDEPKQHCIRKFNSFVLWPFLHLLSYRIIVNTYMSLFIFLTIVMAT